ncbi:MAG: protoporphyrinogen oxidase [Gemmatimonadales bacterium]
MKKKVDVLIVGGGVAGLAAMHRLVSQHPSVSGLLVERDDRLGGKITTEVVDGCVIEGGPDCFLSSKAGGVALCRELGIANDLVGTNPEFRRTYVKRDGVLHELPAGITGLIPARLWPLVRTSVLGWRGKLRASLEPLVPRKRDDEEESIAGFVTRRFGKETYRWLVEPLMSGIYAGDGETLSLRATFPSLIETERTDGSLLRVMMRGGGTQRDPAGRGASNDVKPGFITLRRGLTELIRAMQDCIPKDSLLLDNRVTHLSRSASEFEAVLADGTIVVCSAIVLAVPAFAAADLVASFDSVLSDRLRSIPFVSTSTVSVSLPVQAVHRFGGYGYVSPRAAGGSVVACTWSSNKFPERTDGNSVLIRYFVGRAGSEEIVSASDEEIQRLVRSELAEAFGIRSEPNIWRIRRWHRGMPQYTLGHLDRLRDIESRIALHRGLGLAGASYHGVGIPDCITSGRKAADRVLASGLTDP